MHTNSFDCFCHFLVFDLDPSFELWQSTPVKMVSNLIYIIPQDAYVFK